MGQDDFIIKIFKERFGASPTSKDEVRLKQLFKREEFKRKETLFQSGDSNTKHYFIEKGLVRLYIIDQNGREFNVEFAKENQILGDLTSPEPTNFNLESIEPTIAYSIRDEAIKNILNDINLKNEINSSDIIHKSYIKLQKRLVNMLVNSAETNYAEFREKNPDLVQRLPQYHIAAYLGVSAEFLSKTIAKSIKK